MPKRKPYPTEIAAYAGFDQNGQPAWATFRPTREACAEIVGRYAPEVEGHPPALRIMPVYVGFDLNTQLGLELEDGA